MPTKRNQVVQHLRRAVLRYDEAGLTDGQLLGCFTEHRDEAAVAALVRRHGPMVWGVCRRVLGDHHDAEDAFQATFLVLVRRAASITPRDLVGNWLYGVAHQTALKARALRAKRRTRERQVPAMPEPTATERDLWQDVRPLLDAELSRLPERYRVALVLCDLEGKTRKEAARQLGCPEGTLAARVARGRALLAKRLARHGLAVSGGTLAGVLSREASAAVPDAVASSTIQAVNRFATGPAAAVALSAPVVALTEGVLKAMLLNKIKIAAAVSFLACVLAAGLGAGLLSGLTPPAEAQPPAEQRKGEVADLQRQLRGLDDRVKALTQEIQSLRKELKLRGAPLAGREEFQIFRLRNAVAADAGKMLEELFNTRGKPKRIHVAVEPFTNTILVQGGPLDLQSVEAILSHIDEPAPAQKKDRQDVENERAALRGTWVVVSQNIYGPKTQGVIKQLEWTFQDDKASAQWALAANLNTSPQQGYFGVGKLGLTYTIDPAKSPKEITFTVVKNGSGKLLAIYKLEKDTLTIAYLDWFKDQRPKGFTATDADPNGPPLVVCVLKRKPAPK
jgi:RNA polymerase sigma factor (sigma-70 family)